MRKEISFTADLSWLLERYDLDTYTGSDLPSLTSEIVKLIKEKAKVNAHKH